MSPRERAVARVLFVIGALLMAVAVLDLSLSLDLLPCPRTGYLRRHVSILVVSNRFSLSGR